MTRYTGTAFTHEYIVTARHALWKLVVEQVSINGVQYPFDNSAAEYTGRLTSRYVYPNG